jgi:RNA binding exosome subunit
MGDVGRVGSQRHVVSQLVVANGHYGSRVFVAHTRLEGRRYVTA